MCLRISFYIHFQSGRIYFVKKVKIVVPYCISTKVKLYSVPCQAFVLHLHLFFVIVENKLFWLLNVNMEYGVLQQHVDWYLLPVQRRSHPCLFVVLFFLPLNFVQVMSADLSNGLTF